MAMNKTHILTNRQKEQLKQLFAIVEDRENVFTWYN
jgi:hypothetical protein